VTELAIVVTARRWTSQIEWWVHAKAALNAGLSPDVIEAIRVGASPILSKENQEIYEFTRQIQQTGQVELEVYKAVASRWGSVGVIELAAVIGYYTMVSMTLNVHEIPLPADVASPLPPMPGENTPFPELPPAILEVTP
jgi:4-carboxymuconolactone decarboxylase